jgi:RNA recognition motif-containing protein
MRLYVGNLSYSTTEDILRSEFGKHGTVTEASVVIDRVSGRSRGFGFVEFASPEEGNNAIGAMNGVNLDGREIVVNEARERTGGGGGGGGGRRFGGGGGRGRDDFGGGGGGGGGYGGDDGRGRRGGQRRGR